MRSLVALLTLGLLLLAGSVSAQTPPSSAPAPAAADPFRPTLTIGGYLQGELDAGGEGDSRFPPPDRFFVRRARLTASGAVAKTLTYRLQAEFAGGLGSSSGVTASMTDGYVEWTRFDAAHVRFGQFKAPFGREWLVPSTQMPTVERSLATDRLTLNRQIGVQVAGALAGGRAGYAAAMVNGNGRNTTVNDNTSFMYIVRGTATGWRVADGRLEVGANAYWSDDARLSMSKDFGLDSTPDTSAADNLFSGRRRGAGVDAHFELRVWRVDAELLRVRFEQEPDGGARAVRGQGWYVAPSAFVHGRVIQVAGRYEHFRPDDDAEATTTWTGGMNYYAAAGHARLMADYLWVDAPGHAGTHQKVLAQVQVLF